MKQQQPEILRYYDELARKEAGSGKALAEAIAEQQAEYEKFQTIEQQRKEAIELSHSEKVNQLMEQVRNKDTDNFTIEEWKTLALAGSIYWQ